MHVQNACSKFVVEIHVGCKCMFNMHVVKSLVFQIHVRKICCIISSHGHFTACILNMYLYLGVTPCH